MDQEVIKKEIPVTPPEPDEATALLHELTPRLSEEDADRLATLITAPQNERFAQVMANRIWARLMGRGLVEQPWDWERSKHSHPELLRWLGRELVRSGYDADHILRLILNSHAYQRATDASQKQTSPLFASPAPRRLSATGYVEWVLGDLRAKSSMHVNTELDPVSGALFARNAYNTCYFPVIPPLGGNRK